MMKTIVKSNGLSERMNFEQVMVEFKGIITKMIKKYYGLNVGVIDMEDLMQEGYMAMWKAFDTYNEENCFSTHLTWKLRERFTHLTVNATQEKRDSSKYKMINLEFEIDGNGDKNTTIQDVVADEKVNIEKSITESGLIKFIKENLNEFELKLLLVNLGELKLVDLANEMNVTRQNVSQRNKKFKIKLKALIEEYNK